MYHAGKANRRRAHQISWIIMMHQPYIGSSLFGKSYLGNKTATVTELVANDNAFDDRSRWHFNAHIDPLQVTRTAAGDFCVGE